MDWYFRDGENEVGPLHDSEFHELVSRGRVGPDTPVKNDESPGWQPYSEYQTASMIRRAEAQQQEPSPPLPKADPAMLEAQEAQFDADAARASRILPGMTGGELLYASFGARLVAKLIDTVILSVALTMVTLLLGLMIASDTSETGEPGPIAMLLTLIWLLIFIFGPYVYYAWFVAKRGATPGKAAMGIAVSDCNGKTCGWGLAWGRSFAETLSGMTVGIGYLLALFDDQNRTLHDLVCDTRVIRKL